LLLLNFQYSLLEMAMIVTYSSQITMEKNCNRLWFVGEKIYCSWSCLVINLNLIVQASIGLYIATNYNWQSRLKFTSHCGNLT
jgi:hypothetical protein